MKLQRNVECLLQQHKFNIVIIIKRCNKQMLFTYKKPSTRDAWLFVEKSYDSSTGYNFLRKLIIALSLGFRKQKMRKEELFHVYF